MTWNRFYHFIFSECAKFRGSRAIVGLVGLVPLGHRAFVGLKFFLEGISWIQDFLSWVFRESEIFSRGYFVGLKFFLVGISWVQTLSHGYFVGQNFFSWHFVGPKFFPVDVSQVPRDYTSEE